jgi:hypothetical protein
MQRVAILAIVAAVALSGTRILATPLDAETCTKLKAEQAQLEKAGVRGYMEKGAQWGKTNLAPATLEQIKQLIEIDEQLMFRCRQPHPLVQETVIEPEEGTVGKDKKGDKAAAKTGGTRAKTSAAKPSDASAGAAAPAAAAASAGKEKKGSDQPTAGAKAAKAKPKPKPKADDAYKPPPVNPAINPFASQLEAK